MNYYDKIKEDFNREATNPDGMFSKEWTQADWKIYEYLKKIISPEWKVLEIGCGMGNIIEVLNCFQYGLDISEKMLEKCDIVNKWVGNMDDMHFKDKEFDLAFMCFTLQQSIYPKRTLREAERVARRVIVFDGDKSSSIGAEREKGLMDGSWKSCGHAVWFEPKFFIDLGFEVDHILPHVLVAKKEKEH